MKKTEHILLAKDNEDYALLFRRALKSARIDASLDVVHDGQEAVNYLAGAEGYADRDKHPFPKLLLLDLRMPGSDGLDVLRRISAEKLECRTVLLTAAVSDDQIVEAMLLGAMGVVLKESSPEILIDCVRRVHAGEQCIDRETMTRAFGRALRRESATREAAKTVTPRELEILRLLGRGDKIVEVAEALGISYKTVANTTSLLKQKLGAKNHSDLVRIAVSIGMA